MIEFQKILVPVDFSEPSKKAVAYGLTLAGQFNAKLIIAHVVPESSALAYAFPTETSAIETQQREKAFHEIQDLVPAKHAASLNLQTMVKTGSIEAELLSIVKDEAVNLVVMGTHGRRYAGRWFIGSVTERMLRKVPVPLLTVSHVEGEKHAIAVASLKRILYATDLSEPSNIGLQYAIELARRAGAELTAMHVVDYEDLLLWGPGFITYLNAERTKMIEEMQKKLRKVVTHEKPPNMEIDTVVLQGKSFKKILEVAEDRGMDMIVLNLQSKGMLERAFLGSTAERVIRLARIPVLSVPGGIR